MVRNTYLYHDVFKVNLYTCHHWHVYMMYIFPGCESSSYRLHVQVTIVAFLEALLICTK